MEEWLQIVTDNGRWAVARLVNSEGAINRVNITAFYVNKDDALSLGETWARRWNLEFLKEEIPVGNVPVK